MFNKNKVFIVNRSELEKRFDPEYYTPERKFFFEKLKIVKNSKKKTIFAEKMSFLDKKSIKSTKIKFSLFANF